jgi:hypothetical protein
VPAPLPESSSRPLPWNLGQLRVTAAQLEGRKRSDAFDLTVSRGRELGLVLLDLRGSALEKPRVELAELRQALAAVAILGLREGTPLHAILLDLVRKLFESPLSQLGVTLMRCSALEARVEIATAGMPPVACTHPSGRITLHGVAVPPITALTHSPAPVELAPLVWGATWLVASDGFGQGSDPGNLVERLARQLDLASVGLALSQEPPDTLRALLTRLPATEARSDRDDATLVLLSADPSGRLQSGIAPSHR